jgi:RNAse (barnase) inhibitor barstar
MTKREFVLDGHNMKTLEEFYDEAQKILCPTFKHFGRNWDAFNDILRGGFGAFELGEEILLKVKYKNYIKKHLGEHFLKDFTEIVELNKNVELLWL